MGEFIGWVFAIFSTIIALIQFHKWGGPQKLVVICKLNKWAFQQEIKGVEKIYTLNKPYIEKIGMRHKIIRENHLHLSLREMSNFYENISPDEIEKIEMGNKEIPNEALERLRVFFSIEKEFLDTGDGGVFEAKYHGLVDYIKDGYTPIILCPPMKEEEQSKEVDYMWSFLFLSKKENGFEKSFQYGSPLGFYSNGGGKSNIEEVICSLLINGQDTIISIIAVNSGVWDKARHDDFYLTEQKISRFFAHFEHQETYYYWSKEIEERYQKTGRCY